MMGRLKDIRIVAKKEMKDHLRDRRSLSSALAMPLFYPVLVAVLFSIIATWTTAQRPLRLLVQGQENAPNLVEFLSRAGADVHPATPDFEQLIRDGDEDVAIVVPADYAAKFKDGRTTEIDLVYDGSRTRTHAQVEKARRLLAAYGGEIGALRLIARGVSPSIVSAVAVDDHDVSTKRQQGASLLNIIPVMLLMAAFIGGMHAAIDATAGERERGSLEALLINPITRRSLVLGKWLAVVALALAGVTVALLGFSVALRWIPLEDLGVKASLGPRELLSMLIAVVPLVLFTTSLQMLVSSFARSLKEAQTYVSMMVLVPSLPGIVLSMLPFKPATWMYLIPTLGQQLLMVDVMRGEVVSPVRAIFTVGATVLAAVSALLALMRVLERETTLAGT